MKLSIIIAAWNIENFIEQALHSCIQKDAPPCEIIVVDDASTDRTAELVARFAQTYGKNLDLRLIQKAQNGGLGAARNTGLAAATGDYILFLDGDDWFAEGTFSHLAGIISAQDPDVVIFSHCRAYPDGGTSTATTHDLLIERDTYTLDDRRALMDAFGVAWNKIYRKTFLDKIGLQFRVGLYEDINWSFPILLAAKRLHTTPFVGVFYRQRTGSITRSSSAEHFDVIGEYRALLHRLIANPDLASGYGDELYRCARRQIFHVYNEGRIPEDLRKEYIAQAFNHMKEWRKSLTITSRDIAQVVHEKTGYAGYRSYAYVRRLIRKSRRLARRTVKFFSPEVSPTSNLPDGINRVSPVRQFRDFLREKSYEVMLRTQPVAQNKAFFESYWGAKADCNPLAIAQGLDRLGGYDIVWSFSPSAVIPAGFPWRTVRRGSRAMLREAATAQFFVSNTNLHDSIRKRAGTVHLQTWHGTPLKLMGLDIRPRNPEEMDWKAFVKRSLRWDYVLSSNPHSSYAWRRSCPYPYKMLETGYPRNDIFFNSTDADRDCIRTRLGIPIGKKVALYAPTMRDDLRGSPLAVTGDIFDADAVARALGDDYVVLIRAHYFLRKTDGRAKSAIDVSSYPSSNEIALITDLLITDYSSLMFDYACLRKPIILYQYDYESYLEKRGVYFDISEVPPGDIVKTQDDLLACLADRTFESSASAEKIKRFADRFAPWDDGKATGRVLEQAFGISTIEPKRDTTP